MTPPAVAARIITTILSSLRSVAPLADLAAGVDNDNITGAAEEGVSQTRTRLSADDAVHIYQQKRNKTKGAAVQLAQEYNIRVCDCQVNPRHLESTDKEKSHPKILER